MMKCGGDEDEDDVTLDEHDTYSNLAGIIPHITGSQYSITGYHPVIRGMKDGYAVVRVFIR